jgi:type IV secretory pathway TrbD component
MAATATFQNAWNCRWSRQGHRLTGLSDAVQPESVWVCAREGERRSVCDAECAHCSRWEPFAIAVAPVVVFPLSHPVFAETPRVHVRAPFTSDEVARGELRAVLVLIAIVFAAIGFAVLTSPAAIPFTVALWLCAATSLGFAAFGRFAPTP